MSHIHAHTTHTHAHTHRNTHTHKHICTQTCKCMHAFSVSSMCTPKQKHAHIHSYMHTFTVACTHINTLLCTQSTHQQAQNHKHIDRHALIHACAAHICTYTHLAYTARRSCKHMHMCSFFLFCNITSATKGESTLATLPWVRKPCQPTIGGMLGFEDGQYMYCCMY